tara:strand:- start:1442 stop:1624 length:183 start_codon:yes stop_codon:yes gene_type:complete
MEGYDICVWDVRFCLMDDDGNELKNDDGTVKLFHLNDDSDVSFIAEGTEYKDLVEETNDG